MEGKWLQYRGEHREKAMPTFMASGWALRLRKRKREIAIIAICYSIYIYVHCAEEAQNPKSPAFAEASAGRQFSILNSQLITPPSYHRRQSSQADRMQGGTIVSFTTIRHPPAGFPDVPMQLGLVALDSGAQVIGQILSEHPMIGDRVTPRMRLARVTAQGLRIYEVAYESLARVSVQDDFVFEGYILALTGPSGVGKSTVSKILSKALSEYVTPVPILTTREAKECDESEYIYIAHEEFVSLQDRGLLAAATHIPSNTEDRLYGYRASDITKIWKQGRIPVVVTEMHLLQGLSRTFGRRAILSCGLLPPGRSRRAMLSQLLHRLRSRGRDSEESIADRVKNAGADLDFFTQRRELFDHLLVNDDLTSVVDALKGHVLRAQEEKA